MKLYPYDFGACCMVQMFHAGTVNFNTEGIGEGAVICRIPKGTFVTRAIAVVKTAFNAATTNVLTVGFKDGKNEFLASSDVTAGTVGIYKKELFVEGGSNTEVYAQFTQTGTAATAGSAEIYLEVVPGPEA